MIKKEKLGSGIRLVTEEMPHLKSAVVGVWVKAGSVDENSEISGISHFIEHMMFKGTEGRNAKQIAEDVDMLGGNINAFTSKEATCYYIKVLSENLTEAIKILADMIQNSVFLDEEIEKESCVILEEMKMIEDTPDELAQDILTENIFNGQPLGKSIIGKKETVSSLNRTDMLKYLEDNYSANNIVISVAGAFDLEEVKDTVNSEFTKLNKKEKEREKSNLLYTPSYTSKAKDIEQAHICLGKKSLKLEDEKYYAMSVLNCAFGGGMSSRLFQHIREQKGLAYSVYSMFSSSVEDGYFMIYAGVAGDNIECTVQGLSEELTLLKKNPISKKELDMAKQSVKSGYIFSLENISSRMFALGKNEILLDKTYYPEEIISGIESVGMEDIESLSGTLSDFANYSSVVIGNKEHDIEKIMKDAQI